MLRGSSVSDTARSVGAILSVLLATAAYAPGVVRADAPPSTPAALTARAYSATAGAIRWARSSDDAGAVAGYEVSRAGTVLGTFDALSFVDTALAPAHRYTYTVTAIDSAAQRSPSASVTLETPPIGSSGAGPSGLYASIYSSTALGLAWDRSSTPALRYEISRDNKVLGITDGVSYIDTGLVGGQRFHYAVVAIARNGARSAPSTIAVILPGGSGLEAPTELRTAVYSATAAELFWTRADTFGLRYEIHRDGALIATTDGVSYFDDLLDGGRRYRYDVIALDRSGRRSTAASTSLETTGSGSGEDGNSDRGDIIRADNAVALIAAAFDVYRGEPWGDIAFALPSFSQTPEFPLEAQLTCDNGGTAEITFTSGTTGAGRGYLFDNCQDGASLFDGELSNYQHIYDNVVSADGITVTGPIETLRYSGHVIDARDSSDRAWIVSRSVDFERRTAAGSTYRLSGARLQFIYSGTDGRYYQGVLLEGEFALLSDRTGGSTLQVETLEALSRPSQGWQADNLVFTEGTLRISASEDGSTVLLEADNDDESSARVTITSRAGAATVIEQPWNVWQDNLRFD